MKNLKEIHLTRRGLIRGGFATVSAASLGYTGFHTYQTEPKSDNKEIAKLPPLSSTEIERETARNVIEHAEENFDTFDFQSPEFENAATILFEEDMRESRIQDISNDIDLSHQVLPAAVGITSFTIALFMNNPGRRENAS